MDSKPKSNAKILQRKILLSESEVIKSHFLAYHYGNAKLALTRFLWLFKQQRQRKQTSEMGHFSLVLFLSVKSTMKTLALNYEHRKPRSVKIKMRFSPILIFCSVKIV